MDNFLRLLLDHNLWATRALLIDAEHLSREQFDCHFDIGPGSLHNTLRHVVGAMRRWADRIGGRSLRATIEVLENRYTPHELRLLLDDADTELRAVAADIQARAGWQEVFEFSMPDGSKTYRFTRATAMTHVLTHGMHHRAQALNIRRRLGLPPLALDLDVVEWECVQTGQITDALAVAARG